VGRSRPGRRRGGVALVAHVDGPVGSRTRREAVDDLQGHEGSGWKDEFPEHYTGKDYGGRFYEVFTTSVESVFAGSTYADENMRQWTLGSMILL
jgi:hypothetical protein